MVKSPFLILRSQFFLGESPCFSRNVARHGRQCHGWRFQSVHLASQVSLEKRGPCRCGRKTRCFMSRKLGTLLETNIDIHRCGISSFSVNHMNKWLIFHWFTLGMRTTVPSVFVSCRLAPFQHLFHGFAGRCSQ